MFVTSGLQHLNYCCENPRNAFFFMYSDWQTVEMVFALLTGTLSDRERADALC